MKKNLFMIITCMAFFAFMSCSSDDEDKEQQNPQDEYVEVGFDLTGDFIDVEERPMRAEDHSNTYHLIHILTREDFEDVYQSDYRIGYVGMFTDVQYARLKLKRGVEYMVTASTFIEKGYEIDLNNISKLFTDTPTEEGFSPEYIIDIYNKFNDDYYFGYLYNPPYFNVYHNDKVDRFYSEKFVTVNSNETIKMNLDRFSYKLNLDIVSPSEGRVELSCRNPEFKYVVGTNDPDLYQSDYYSLNGFDINNTEEEVTLKLDKYDSQGKLINTSTKKISVKANVEITLHINYDLIDANNGFDFTLEESPMEQVEINWN